MMNSDKSGNGEDGTDNDSSTPGSGRSARDAVTPLAHMSYADQLEQKKTSIMQTLKKLVGNSISLASHLNA